MIPMLNSRNPLPRLILLLTLALTGFSGVSRAQTSQKDALCPPLAPSPGPTTVVSTVNELVEAVNSASPGEAILVADGTYALAGAYLRIDVPGVTLRSQSGDREAVVLDGGYQTTEIVQVVASNVTIADLTLTRAYYHPIHVTAGDSTDTTGTTIYNVHVSDPGQQAIKINQNGTYTHYADDGLIACSHIQLTDAGRPMIWEVNGSCYTGGVDGHQAWGWVLRDNLIEGFWCEDGLSEHGIHFWTGSRDTLVERNELRENARGIGLGLGSSGGNWRTYGDLPCPGVESAGHYGGMVRNNMVFAGRAELLASQSGFDCGICLEQACSATVAQNTVVSTQAPFSSIEWRFGDTSVDLSNNLVSHNLRERDGASATLAGNLETAPLSLFLDPVAGDLHLKDSASQAIDQGVDLAVGVADDDFDGDPRPIGGDRDIGADEFGTPPPAAVADLRLTGVTESPGMLEADLAWSETAGVVAVDLRYSTGLITASNWGSAQAVPGPIPVGAGSYTATVPYTGGTVFFALKLQNSEGEWSDVSNNVFWPAWSLYVPLLEN